MKLTTEALRQIIKEEVQSAELEQLLHGAASEIAAIVLEARAGDSENDDDFVNDDVHPDVFNILMDLVEKTRQFKL